MPKTTFFGIGVLKFVIATIAIVGSSPAFAGLIGSVSGDLIEVSPPSSLIYSNGLLGGDPNPSPIIFSEYNDFIIPTFSASDPLNPILVSRGLTPSGFIGLDYLELNVVNPGAYPPNLPSTFHLNSGTEVSTYIVNFEPSDTNPVGSANGSVTFNSNVIGIETMGFSLIRDLLFELPNISLFGGTGLEIGDSDPSTADTLSLSSDRRTVSFSLNVNGAADAFRIFLEPSVPMPEPGNIFTFPAGLLFLYLVALGTPGRGQESAIEEDFLQNAASAVARPPEGVLKTHPDRMVPAPQALRRALL
ncbi:MAG TPA: hypothetical protein VHT51_20845 [Micropepsaceae bacterium]|jgi:hypothetical protein|nr:hypothetical protein [Micropepsaceae bacterium]